MANQFVAFQDDRHGLGAWVAGKVAEVAFPNVGSLSPTLPVPDEVPNGERAAFATASYGLSLSGNGSAAMPAAGRRRLDPSSLVSAYKAHTSPRATAESTVSSVVSGQAAWGVLPLFSDDGFDKGTLAALADFPQARPQREFVASSNFVLAVPADLIHEAEQAGFTDSFSPGSASDFQFTPQRQAKYRQRIDTVLASNDAMRRCGPALDGMRTKGIDVQLVPDGTDSYRAGLQAAASMLDPDRQVETRFGTDGQQRRSRTSARNAHKGLTAVLLTFDKAMGENGYLPGGEYVVLDTDMAGADPVRTAYIAVSKSRASSKGGPVRSAMAEVDRVFAQDPQTMGRARDDDRPSRADFAKPGTTLRQVGDDGAVSGAPDYARVLWKVDTTGESGPSKARVGDYSKVIAKLNALGLPHKVTPLEGRPGNPVVIAFDLSSRRRGKAKGVFDLLRTMRGSQHLGTFPATEPLVDPAQLPKAEGDGGPIRVLTMIVAVLGALGLFLGWRFVTG